MFYLLCVGPDHDLIFIDAIAGVVVRFDVLQVDDVGHVGDPGRQDRKSESESDKEAPSRIKLCCRC